jgi:hypothetical protein
VPNHDALNERIAALEELAHLGAKAAPAAAQAVERVFERQIATGRDPNGKVWEPRQDGGQPLKTAAKALRVAGVGTKILCVLTGYIARHNKGTAKGGIVRAIFPAKGLPPELEKAVRTEVTKEFREIMGP